MNKKSNGIQKKHIFVIILTISFILVNFVRIYTLENGLTAGVLTEDTQVHFIDVGQGDSSLILSGGEAILIDAGPNLDEKNLVAYLKSLGIDKLKLIVATHPHEDHIGGIDAVLRDIGADEVLMTDNIHTTKAYTDMLDAIDETGTKLTMASPGDKYTLKTGATLSVLAPHQDDKFENLNDYSIVTRLQAGKNSVLFTGDIEAEGEKSLLLSNALLKSDILKSPHHGSVTSSTLPFIRLVKPKTAIISCGKNNKYGHPHKEILDLYKNNNIDVRRTDKEGTIIYNFEVAS